MRRKKMLIAMVFCFICLGLMLPSIATARVDLKVGQIAMIGYYPVEGAGIMVKLIDVNGASWAAGTARQFYLSETLGDRGFATLLTAYSMGKTVWVRIAGDGSEGSLISIIYIND